MAERLRFVSGPTGGGGVLLDLNDDLNWKLGRGLDLGTTTADRTYLAQAPHPGAILATSYQGIVQMRIPIYLMKQTGATELIKYNKMRDLMAALGVELDKPTNVLEYRPRDADASFFIDTYRADVPSLAHGHSIPSAFYFKASASEIVLNIDREPILRGAGAYI